MTVRRLLLVLGLLTASVTLLYASAPASAASSCGPQTTAGTTQTSGGGGLMLGLSLDQLTSRSSHVLTGRVESFRTCAARDGSFTTIVTITVRRYLKAPPGAPDSVAVEVPGGRIGNAVQAVGTSPEFVAGEEVLVFLQSEGGRLRVAGAYQGKRTVAPGDLVEGVPLRTFEDAVDASIRGELPRGNDPLAGTAGRPTGISFVTKLFQWFAQDIPVHFWANPNSSRPAQLTAANVVTAWTSAFATWQNQPSSSIAFAYQGQTARTSSAQNCASFGDGNNDLTWGIVGAHDPATLAITYICYEIVNPGQDRIRDADIQFDTDHWGSAWRTDGTGACGSGIVDLESVTLHEAGHFIGLNHPGTTSNCPIDQCPVMNPLYVGVKRTPCLDDAAGAAALYPAAVGGIAELAPPIAVAPTSGAAPGWAIAVAVMSATALGGALWYARRRDIRG